MKIVCLLLFAGLFFPCEAAVADTDDAALALIMELPWSGQKYILGAKELVDKCSLLLQKSKGLSKDQLVALHYHKACGLLLLKEEDRAREEFDDVLALAPDDVKTKCMRINCFPENETLLEFEKICRAHSKDGLALSGKAAALFAGGKFAESLSCYSNAIDCLESERTPLLSRNTRAQAYYGRAYCWWQMGEYDKALADLNRAIVVTPYGFLPEPAHLYFTRGSIHFLKGNSADALADIDMGLRIDSKSAAGRSLQIQILLNIGRKQIAKRIAEDFVRDQPPEKEVVSSYISVLLSLDMSAKALEVAGKLAKENPNKSWPDVMVGRVCFERGDYEKSLSFASKGLEADPKSMEALRIMVQVLAAAPDAKLRDGKKAKELAARLVKLESPYPWLTPLLFMSIAVAECGEFDEAVRLARDAGKKSKTKAQRDFGSALEKLYLERKPYRLNEGLHFQKLEPRVMRADVVDDSSAYRSLRQRTNFLFPHWSRREEPPFWLCRLVVLGVR